MISEGAAKNTIRYKSGGPLTSQRPSRAALCPRMAFASTPSASLYRFPERRRRMSASLNRAPPRPSGLLGFASPERSFGNEVAGVDRPAHLDRIAHFEKLRAAALRICAQRLDRRSVLRRDFVDGHVAHVQELGDGAAVMASDRFGRRS